MVSPPSHTGLFLSPDFNPSEETFSYVKHYLKVHVSVAAAFHVTAIDSIVIAATAGQNFDQLFLAF